MEVLITAAIAVAVTLFVLWPLMRGQVSPRRSLAFCADGGRPGLLREKEAAIKDLKEMEFDYVSGKLSLEDYSRLKGGFEDRVVWLLKGLDEHGSENSISAALEEEIAAARAKAGSVAVGCLQCGFLVGAGFNYCPACGARVDHSGTGTKK